MSLLPRSLIFCAISVCSLAAGNEPFPVVDKAVQQARDIDRRAILETELAAEEQALGLARAALAKMPGDRALADAHRHEENVKALRRELARLQEAMPVRVNARKAPAGDTVAAPARHQSSQAPFWDVYRRNAPPVDVQPPPAKELP
ncbi:hypothetical protein [uncultured Massilia sp.]|uniref:hypothetical protein n=1 Tax=uncultured Massilia sp. TaxID=169973 RepID=UPI0025D95AA5|nr:hypothetical protein [uncultured Massilia sp.]